MVAVIVNFNHCFEKHKNLFFIRLRFTELRKKYCIRKESLNIKTSVFITSRMHLLPALFVYIYTPTPYIYIHLLRGFT